MFYTFLLENLIFFHFILCWVCSCITISSFYLNICLLICVTFRTVKFLAIFFSIHCRIYLVYLRFFNRFVFSSFYYLYFIYDRVKCLWYFSISYLRHFVVACLWGLAYGVSECTLFKNVDGKQHLPKKETKSEGKNMR